jgi:uncharacterized membrane protein YdjX (TVP38/TMEM64 family)
MASTEQAAPECMRSNWLHKYGPRLLALAFSLTITVVILLYRDQILHLGAYGYLGVFLISMLGTATVILPVPSLAVVFAGGGVLNPLLVGLVAGLGEPIGELTAYLAGYAGNAVVEDSERFARIRHWMEQRGFVTLFVLSVIPNPLFDWAGIAAGMLKFPVPRFLLACWMGKTIKAVAIAYLGSVSVLWFEELIRWMAQLFA